MLYAARTVCGVKQRRPTDSHWTSVGGVVPVETSCASLNIGCGSGSDCTPPPRTTTCARASATVTTATIGIQYRLNRSASMSKPPLVELLCCSPASMPPWIGCGCRELFLLMELRLYAARRRTEIRHEVAVLCHISAAFNVPLRQRIDRLVQPRQGQGIHPSFQDLARHLDRRRMPPARLRLRIDPGEFGIVPDQALQPHTARLGIPVLHAAAGLSDLIRTHGRIAHQNELVIGAVSAHQFDGTDVFIEPPSIVPPQRLIREIVKIIVLEMLELAARRGKQLLAGFDVVVHRSADIQQQQDLRSE